MAEAILRRWGGGEFRAFSCGLMPSCGIDSQAREILQAQRIWQSDLAPRSCAEFLSPEAPQMDFVISVGERPPAGAPTTWPGGAKLIHWRITDPMSDPDPQHREGLFRRAFLELENRIKLFVLVYQREATKTTATAA
jgi:protein-tyrosine-phosphatase